MSEPLSITVESAKHLMQEALNHAVEQHGNKAKGIAWDVKLFFLDRLPPTPTKEQHND